jgi:phosphoribosylanthranilate isomerase
MIVKVCGMRDADNIRDVEALDIDWMGFIFYPKSSRDVSGSRPPYLPSGCKRVGVMVNPSLDEIRERQADYRFDLIQLHGDESPEFCTEVKSLLPEVKFIKMVQVTDKETLNAAVRQYEEVVDYFLFETKTSGYGGSGRQFDWTLLQSYEGRLPFLITGGIGPDDAEKVKAFSHPKFAGIDINSRFETAPALKDVNLIRRFVSCVKP